MQELILGFQELLWFCGIINPVNYPQGRASRHGAVIESRRTQHEINYHVLGSSDHYCVDYRGENLRFDWLRLVDVVGRVVEVSGWGC